MLFIVSKNKKTIATADKQIFFLRIETQITLITIGTPVRNKTVTPQNLNTIKHGSPPIHVRKTHLNQTDGPAAGLTTAGGRKREWRNNVPSKDKG